MQLSGDYTMGLLMALKAEVRDHREKTRGKSDEPHMAVRPVDAKLYALLDAIQDDLDRTVMRMFEGSGYNIDWTGQER